MVLPVMFLASSDMVALDVVVVVAVLGFPVNSEHPARPATAKAAKRRCFMRCRSSCLTGLVVASPVFTPITERPAKTGCGAAPTPCLERERRAHAGTEKKDILAGCVRVRVR